MTIDISKLSVQQLDDLLVQVAKRRIELSPHPGEPPQGEVHAIVNPRWYVSPNEDNTILQIRHEGYGWLNFAIPAVERAVLIGLLTTQALITSIKTNPSTAITPNTPTGSGGATIH